MRKTLAAALIVAGAAFIAVPAAAQNARPQPVVTARAQSIDEMLVNLKPLARAVGKQEIVKQAEAFFRPQGGQAREGIDVKKPMGFYVVTSADGSTGAGVWALPVKSEEVFLRQLALTKYPATKNPDGSYAIEQNAVPMPVGLRFANGYAYVAGGDLQFLAAANLVPPAELFPKTTAGTVFSAILHMERIPRAAKDSFKNNFIAGMQNSQKKLDAEGKSELEKKVARKTMDVMSEAITDVVEDATQVAVHLNAGAPTKSLSFDVKIDARKDSRLKKSIAGLGQAQNLFAGLMHKDADAMQMVRLSVPAGLKSVLLEAWDDAVRKAMMAPGDPQQKALGEKFYQAIRPTLAVGDFHGATYLKLHPGGTATFVGGFKLRQGVKVEEALRFWASALPPQERDRIKLNVAKAGAVNIHQFNVQDTFVPPYQGLFGAQPLFVAIRHDAIFFALGTDGMSALKQAVAAPASTTNQLLSYQLKVGKILSFVATTEKQKTLAKKIFAKDDGPFSFAVEGGPTLRIHGSIGLSVIEFFAALTPGTIEVRHEENAW